MTVAVTEMDRVDEGVLVDDTELEKVGVVVCVVLGDAVAEAVIDELEVMDRLAIGVDDGLAEPLGVIDGDGVLDGVLLGLGVFDGVMLEEGVPCTRARKIRIHRAGGRKAWIRASAIVLPLAVL